LQHRDFTVRDVLVQSLADLARSSDRPRSRGRSLLGLAGGAILACGRSRSKARPATCARVVATLGLALPNFVLAGLLVLLFAITACLAACRGLGLVRTPRAAKLARSAHRSARTSRACSRAAARSAAAGLHPHAVAKDSARAHRAGATRCRSACCP
jgi:hypothetical protein